MRFDVREINGFVCFLCLLLIELCNFTLSHIWIYNCCLGDLKKKISAQIVIGICLSILMELSGYSKYI